MYTVLSGQNTVACIYRNSYIDTNNVVLLCYKYGYSYNTDTCIYTLHSVRLLSSQIVTYQTWVEIRRQSTG